ncbi:MAG: anthranilate synthase component I family protein [Bacteroidales bacterium]|nr:anthranilate synthase component I family protein [Bacteroidales bacterium]
MKTFSYNVALRPIPGDLATPVSTYLKIRDLFPQSALMESSDYHGAENNRSFIALEPIASISVAHDEVVYNLPDRSRETKKINSSFTVPDAFADFMSRFEVQGEYAHYCGLYGYMGFNAVHYFENIDIKDSRESRNDAPDICYILYRYLVVFNDYHNEMMLLGLEGDGAGSRMDDIEHAIRTDSFPVYSFRALGEAVSTITDDEHRENIRRGIAHCMRGDVFQIVLSRRFVQKFEGDDFQLYRALRQINPSPYLFYFDFGGFRIFGSSPETHCRIEGGRAYIDPIAGTMKRIGDRTKDEAIAAALLADPKENAEHTMLVDLARNDLSRNCSHVKVDFFKDVQYYSHVIHLVSRVSGELKPGVNPIKLLADTFPAGTLSGAPKVKAMELISRYEPHNRGAYGGCIGFIGLNGSLNQAITIRTFVSRNGELWFQAGGGIVAASDVEAELAEVNNKLGALRRAITKCSCQESSDQAQG